MTQDACAPDDDDNGTSAGVIAGSVLLVVAVAGVASVAGVLLYRNNKYVHSLVIQRDNDFTLLHWSNMRIIL